MGKVTGEGGPSLCSSNVPLRALSSAANCPSNFPCNFSERYSGTVLKWFHLSRRITSLHLAALPPEQEVVSSNLTGRTKPLGGSHYNVAAAFFEFCRFCLHAGIPLRRAVHIGLGWMYIAHQQTEVRMPKDFGKHRKRPTSKGESCREHMPHIVRISASERCERSPRSSSATSLRRGEAPA